jgi:tRNA dimethylallyltransferase
LGYQQVLAYLDGGCPAEQARADTVQATRRFGRRQRSWFRRDDRITWLDGQGHDLVPDALRAIVEG